MVSLTKLIWSKLYNANGDKYLDVRLLNDLDHFETALNDIKQDVREIKVRLQKLETH